MAAQFDVIPPLGPVDLWKEARRNHSALIKANGLYPLLETLIKEKHSIAITANFSKHKIKDKAGDYYLAKFPENSIEDLFEDHTCVERHLRIDEDYSDFRHQPGLSPAHFSEYWQHETSGTRIIVHVYYLDRMQTVQAKTDKGDIVSLTEALIQKIKRNAAGGFELYRQLVEERDQRLKKAIEDSDKTLEYLTALSMDLALPAKKEEYIRVGRVFVNMVEDINQYAGGSFPRDRRGDFILARISQIAAYSQQARVPRIQEPKPVIIEEPEATASSNYVSISPVLTKEAKKISEEQLKLEEIKTLIDRLEKQKDKGWTVESYQIAERLRNALFDLAFIDTTSGLPRKPLIKMAKKWLSLLPEPGALASKVASAGDLENFKILLPMLSQGGCLIVYTELLNKLFITKEDEGAEAQNLRRICEYLFENDKLYTLMLRVSSLTVFTKDLQVSSLCCAYIFRKLLTFKMLLRHGCDPNAVAYRDKAQCYSLAKAMTFHDSPEVVQADYFDCLFKSGLEVDVSYKDKQITSSIPTMNLSQYLNASGTSQAYKNLRLLPADVVNAPQNVSLFDLTNAVSYQSWKIAQLLISRSHLTSLALALVSMANITDRFANGRAVAPTPVGKGVMIFPNQEARSMALEVELTEDNPENRVSVRYLIARKTASEAEYQCMEAIYQAFVIEYKKYSKRAMSQHIQSLLNLIPEKKIEPLYQVRIYNACIALLIHGGRLDLADSEEVLKLLQRSAICYAISENAAFQQVSTQVYLDIDSFAEQSVYSAELVNSKPYRAACVALAKPVITAATTPAYQRTIVMASNAADNSVRNRRVEP